MNHHVTAPPMNKYLKISPKKKLLNKLNKGGRKTDNRRKKMRLEKWGIKTPLSSPLTELLLSMQV